MADDLGKLLQAAADSWQAQLRGALADHTPAAALGAGAAVLPHLGGASLLQTELTARMGLSKQAVQQLLDQLETQGLVRRVPDAADKRAKRVELTESGAAAAAKRQHAEAVLEDGLREGLGKKRFKSLRKALRELSAG
ncbi:MAG: MarR family transcriptional regulator [Devosia sp.]